MVTALMRGVIGVLLLYGLHTLSRPRTISSEEYERIKGRAPMLQPLLELQNIYNPGMKDLLRSKTEFHEERDDEGDPPEPGLGSKQR